LSILDRLYGTDQMWRRAQQLANNKHSDDSLSLTKKDKKFG